jgi:hypothetical protein
MSIALFGGWRCARALRLLFGLVAMVIVAGFVTAPAQAQFTQQDKLVGAGAAGAAAQGFSVALSADGTTAIVGGVDDNCCRGAAWVFVRNNNGAWTQQGGKLVGAGAAGAANQGASVALSADGNTAIVGGPSDNGNAGAAWIFVRRNGVWRRQGGKLVGSDVVGAAGQGVSVALSADGDTAMVGGPFDNGDVGAAWVYTRSGNVWTQQGGKLIGPGAAGPANQGYSVALSTDGNTAIIGGLGDNGDRGAAWVFIRRSGVWRQQGGKLVGSGANGSARQGTSVAVSGDGNTALIGGPSDNCCEGAAWVFTRSGNVWTQQGNKLVGAGAIGGAEQGFSVSLSGDGNTAIVGGPFHNFFVGATWIFVRKNGVWRQGGRLHGRPARGPAAQGASVALSSDGDTAIVGGIFDNFGAGAAWVFGRPGIAAISPNTGTVAGGTRVTIVGRNFFDVTGVTFGGVPATNVITVDPTTVRATTPPHSAGAVNVVVTTRTGGSKAIDAFTYVPGATTTQLISSANPSRLRQRVTFTASVTAEGGPASGSVTFKNGSQTLGTVNLRGGVARLSTTDLPTGAHTIKAIYQRNGNFLSSRDSLLQRVRSGTGGALTAIVE